MSFLKADGPDAAQQSWASQALSSRGEALDGFDSQNGLSLSTCPVLDLEAALDHTGGDRELLAQLCNVFASESPAELEEVRAAVEARTRISIERAAHKLKGSALALGGVQTSQAALLLENAASEGDMEQIHACFEELRLALDSLRARACRLEKEMTGESDC